MPTYVPPTLPPVHNQPANYTGQKQNQDQDQKQNQDQQQNIINNPSSSDNANNLRNDVVSNPDATINQNQASYLSSYQVNSNTEPMYVKYSTGTEVPVAHTYFDFVYNNNSWSGDVQNSSNFTVTGGIRVPFGGKHKRAAAHEVAVNTLARQLSICNSMGVFDGKTTIDYENITELAPCQYVGKPAQKVVAKVPAKVDSGSRLAEIRRLRLELEQSRLQMQILQQQQLQIEQGTPTPGDG